VRAAVRRNSPVVSSVLRDADVNRTIKWITAERARDHLFSRLVASIGSPELFDTDRLVTESLSKARQEVRDALTLAIETTCQGAGRNRNDVDRDDEKHGCEDCGHPVAGPMLHDAIWATIAEKITLRPARSVGAGGIRHIIRVTPDPGELRDRPSKTSSSTRPASTYWWRPSSCGTPSIWSAPWRHFPPSRTSSST
jgi:hypothetical protein